MRYNHGNEDMQISGEPLMEQRAAAAYTAGHVRLYQADFLDVAGCIRDNSIDLVFTDPPYELVSGGMKNGKLKYKAGEIFRSNGFSTKNIHFDRWIPEIYRILKDNRYFYVMSNDRHLFPIHSACVNAGFRFCELLVMDKKMTVPSTYYPKRAEFILMYRKGGFRKAHFSGSTVMEARLPRGKDKRHPTEKPVSIIEHLVRCSTREHELCFDPFMGSCSTGEACVNVGRAFIGTEIETRWFQVSRDRIAHLWQSEQTNLGGGKE